ncbi:pepsin/retropepsin-like aspartic protease family protein [Pedobacter jeongneungensis]|uniref:pepsin/retropepsin-like aspartic protease family protein n=1 Tax=Pedobacter jeongneungensis TaxID=947309 RepID=UPI0004688B41|nr:pepsin/retropepsin-like aspartic protease family protein [Pedobacter jeongneungensis]
MKKVLFISLFLITKAVFAQQEPTDVQIKYALQLFGQNLKKHNVKDIATVLDETFHIAEYRDRDLTNVLPQVINPVILDTVYYENIVKKNNRIYARQIAVPHQGPKMISWVRMNNYLMFDRIGHFEQLMGMPDPIGQELQPAKLLSKTAIKRSSSLMFIEVKIKGSSEVYSFMFDSGAGATSLSEDVAKKLGLKVNQQAIDIKTAGNGGQFKTIDTLDLTIGGLNVKGKQLVVADLKGLQKVIGRPMDGIIGFDLLKDYQVAINLDNSEMSIYNFGYLEANGKSLLPVKLTNNIPKIEANLKVDGIEYKTRLLFDTGAAGAISGNYFLNAYTNGLTDKMKNKMASAAMDLSGNVSKSEMGTIDAITIAGASLNNPAISLDLPKEQPAYGFDRHGLLGMSLLGRFNFTFNYNLAYIAISPNKTFSMPMVPLYALGLGFVQDGSIFKITHVDEKGLAYKAGLRTGDELITINQINPISVDQITQQLRVLAKNNIELQVNRKQQKMKFELKKFEI